MSVETYILYLGTVLLFFAHPPGPSQLLFVGGSFQHGLRRTLPIMAGGREMTLLHLAKNTLGSGATPRSDLLSTEPEAM